jgi:hypothetical protein
MKETFYDYGITVGQLTRAVSRLPDTTNYKPGETIIVTLIQQDKIPVNSEIIIRQQPETIFTKDVVFEYLPFKRNDEEKKTFYRWVTKTPIIVE